MLAKAIDILKNLRLKWIDHPPYSDFVTCDYFLFLLKRSLKERQFLKDSEAITMAVYKKFFGWVK